MIGVRSRGGSIPFMIGVRSCAGSTPFGVGVRSCAGSTPFGVGKAWRVALVLAATLFSASCRGDTVLGFAIGDISGLWIAESIVYTANTTSGGSVDVVQRDGASLTLAVDNGSSPPVASMSWNDGLGGTTVGGGTVDIGLGTLRIGADVYVVADDGDRLTLTKADAMFDFGTGAQPATLTIELNRL